MTIIFPIQKFIHKEKLCLRIKKENINYKKEKNDLKKIKEKLLSINKIMRF